jgi:DNA-directed RNA polymerase subunit RPC12/RpoP
VSDVVLAILLGALALFLILGMVRSFGHPVVDGRRSRCPACATNTLKPLDAQRMPGRLDMYRCESCGRGFREQLDGSLAEMT